MDRSADVSKLVKSKISSQEKQCELDEIVTEDKIIVETIKEIVDGMEIAKEIETVKTVLKDGIIEKAGKYYRSETEEESLVRYNAISQE